MIEVSKDNKTIKINYLHHIIHYSNIENILLHGILSHNEVYRRSLLKTDISMNEIQDRRKIKSVDNIYLHDYASLYFCSRNPMLFKRKEIQEELLILLVDPSIIDEPGTVFSDGNAANKITKFYKGSDNLVNLPLEFILYHSFWSDVQDGKRIKCAEVLVYPKVPVNKIFYIVCPNSKIENYVYSFNQNPRIAELTQNLSLSVERSFYF